MTDDKGALSNEDELDMVVVGVGELGLHTDLWFSVCRGNSGKRD